MESTFPYQQQTPAFVNNAGHFSPDHWRKLNEIMMEQQVKANTHLFWDGDPADALFFIKSGRIKVTKLTDKGKKLTLHLFQAGDLFGEFSYDGATYGFNGETLSDCTLGIIPQQELEILLSQHGDMAVAFMKWMSLMHRMTQSKLRDLMLYGKSGALCSTLIRLANTYGHPVKNGIRISKQVTHAELGDFIGAPRESVSRLFNQLKQDQVVTCEQGHIIIKDFAYLKEVCHCEHCPIEICRI